MIMKTLKLFAVVFILGLFTNYVQAGEDPKEKKAEVFQIQNLLELVDFRQYITKETKIQISFFVNSRNEIIATTTKDYRLDSVIKNALNHKTIEMKTLKSNKVYTVPITVRIQ